jgi:hypothetical protein
VVARDLDLGLQAERGFLEGDGEIVAQVVAPPPPAALPAATEDVAEDIAEDVLEGAAAETTRRKAPAAAQTGMAELVVGGSFLRIREDGIGLGELLEPLSNLISGFCPDGTSGQPATA